MTAYLKHSNSEDILSGVPAGSVECEASGRVGKVIHIMEVSGAVRQLEAGPCRRRDAGSTGPLIGKRHGVTQVVRVVGHSGSIKRHVVANRDGDGGTTGNDGHEVLLDDVHIDLVIACHGCDLCLKSVTYYYGVRT